MTHNLRITIAALLTLNHGVSAQENTAPLPELTAMEYRITGKVSKAFVRRTLAKESRSSST